MRGKGAILAAVGLALLASGCTDSAYLRSGVGTDLVSADLAASGTLQEIYVGEICRQAGLRVVQQGDALYCEEVSMRPREWTTFVQAGMNDIDRRCDAYLAWIDNKRRWQEPILRQINSTAAATAAILGLSGVGAVPIAIVGASFGFAQETFVNISARLITEVNHSVVQSVVLDNQNRFRARIAGIPVDTRPAAIYMLRNYLRICMPFSIEMSINNTMTVYHRGGGEALDRNDPILLQPSRVARVTAASIGPAARDVIVRPPSPPVTQQPPNPAYRTIIASYDPNVHTIPRIEPILRKLCVPAADLGVIDPKVNVLIQIYQQATGAVVTGQLTTSQLARLNNVRDCATNTFRNYYEANLMTSGLNSSSVINALNTVLPAGQKIPAGASVAEIRGRIPEVRRAIAGSLQIQSPVVSDQFTADMMAELFKRGL